MKEFNLKLVFQAIDRASAPIRKIGEAVGQVARATGLNKVAAAAGAVGAGLANVAGEAVRFGGLVATGVTAAGGALLALVKKSAGAADELAKAADRLGVGIEPLQRLEYHAGLSGVATDQFRDSLRFMVNAAGETARGVGAAGETFSRLGIRVTDNKGKLKDAESLMYEVADAISRIENPTLRVMVAQDLFGRSGASMINVLKDGAEAMREAGREAEQLGILTEEQVRASEEFNDNFDRLAKVVSHFADMLAGELLPYMNDFVVWLRAAVIEMRPAVVEALTAAFVDVGAAVRWAVDAWKSVSATIGTWLTIVAAVSPAIAGMIARTVEFVRTFGLTETVVSLLATALGAKLLFAIVGLFVPLAQLAWSLGVVAVRMTVLAASAMQWMIRSLAAILPAIAGAVAATGAWAAALAGQLVSALAAAAAGMGTLAASGIRALLAGFASMVPVLSGVVAATWAWTAALLANPLTWIVLAVVAAVAALGGAAYLLYENWDDVAAWFTAIWDGLAAVVADAVAAISTILGGFDPSGLAGAVAAGWRALTGWIGDALAGLVDLLSGIDLAAIGGRWIAGLAGAAMAGWRALTGWIGDALAGLVDLLSGIDLAAIGGRWIAGLAGAAMAGWQALDDWIGGALAGLVDALARLDLTAAGAALVAGLAAGAVARWDEFKGWLAEAAASLGGLLPDAGFGDLGRAWVDQLFAGVAEGWGRLRAWLADQVEELLDILPDWVREKVGLDGLRAPAAAGPVQSAPAVSSALSATKAQVEGTVRVAFENAPAGMRVRDVAADPGGVDIAVDAGYALAP